MQRMHRNRFGIAAFSSLFAIGCPSDADPDQADASTGGAQTEAGASTNDPGTGSGSGGATTNNLPTTGPTSVTTTGPTSTTDDSSPTTNASADTGTSDTEPSDEFDVIELRGGGFSPPVTETFYSCFSFTVSVEQLHHIVGFRPVVDNPIIHHYVLSIAPGVVQTDPSDSCVEWPADILWAWAPGIEETMLPDEAGFLLGDAPGGQHTFILQVHYNDPLGQGIVDDNGLDVLITPNLRPNPAGIFSQGDIGAISIPPGQSAYEHEATCGGAFTTALLSEPVHVFSSFLHAHEIGSAIWTDVERDGNPVGQVAIEDPFDFNTQKFVPADIDIMPGDTIRTTCRYDSTGRAGTTAGGPASNEEMCINFLMYYPRVAGQKCGSL